MIASQAFVLIRWCSAQPLLVWLHAAPASVWYDLAPTLKERLPMHPPIILRPFIAEDHAALSHILRATWQNDSTTASYYRFGSASAPDAARFMYTLVAVCQQQVIGFGSLWTNRVHPHTLYIGVIVHPRYQGQGIGAALYAQLIDARGPYTSFPLQTATWSDCPHAVTFLTRRGFLEDKRTYLPVIHLSDIGAARFVARPATTAGYRIVSLADLPATAARNRQLVALATATYRATHASNPPAQLPPAEWEALVLSNLIEPGCFVVLHGAEYIGFSLLHPGDQPGSVALGWHGVAHRHDERRLIQALLAHELTFARQQGYTTLQAEIDTTDPCAMLLLEWLPIATDRAWITLRVMSASGLIDPPSA